MHEQMVPIYSAMIIIIALKIIMDTQKEILEIALKTALKRS